MIGILLVFVGVTLVLNAITPIKNWGIKNLFLLNLFTGFLIILVNVYTMLTTADTSKYVGCLGGLLFGLTNLFIAFDNLYSIEKRGFGLFSLFATIIALAISGYYFYYAETIKGIMWGIWSLIWLFSFIANLVSPKFKKASYIMNIFQGIITTFIFGLLLVFKVVAWV